MSTAHCHRRQSRMFTRVLSLPQWRCYRNFEPLVHAGCGRSWRTFPEGGFSHPYAWYWGQVYSHNASRVMTYFGSSDPTSRIISKKTRKMVSCAQNEWTVIHGPPFSGFATGWLSRIQGSFRSFRKLPENFGRNTHKNYLNDDWVVQVFPFVFPETPTPLFQCQICVRGGGGGGGGKPEARRWRQSLGGSGSMLPQKSLKFRSPEMPFPEAISSSYLIQVMIF